VTDLEAQYEHVKREPCTNRYIKPIVLSLCKRHKAKRLLDLGCGNGTFCKDLINAGFQVVGIDPSESGMTITKHHAPEAQFYQMGVYDDPEMIAETEFDIAISIEVVEHLYDPNALPRFASAKLKEGGLLVLSTPYHGYLKNVAIALTGKWDKHHFALWQGGRIWEGGHIKFWSKRTLSAMLQANGFRVIEFYGAGRFLWFWKSMILVAQKEGRSS